MTKNVNIRQEKLSNLYIKILDAINMEQAKFLKLQKEAIKVGEYRTKYNFTTYDLVSKKLMSCVIRLSRLKNQLNDIGDKLGLPF